MKKKMTLEQKIAKRKYKIPNPILWWFLMRVVLKPFLSPKFNPHIKVVDDINKEKGPAFLIYNHQSRCDYIYITQAVYPKRINFVVGYNEFFRSHLHLILKMLNAIPKKNFTIDMVSIKAMSSIIKQGGVVCLAPEGMSSITGHNQPVGEGTGKLFKHYGIPVYLVKLNGAFLSNTKVCLDERKGRVDATLTKLFDPEDLKNMSAEEIQLKTDEALWHDDYEWNKKEHVKFDGHGNMGSHLHDLLYRCPKCGHELEMIGEKDYIKCNHCGNGATINDYYEFVPFDETCVLPESPSKWVDEERQIVIKEIRNNLSFSFKEHVKIGKLPDYKLLKDMKTSEICGEGDITIDHQGVHYVGTKDGEPWSFDLSYNMIPTTGMVTDVSFFATYVNGKYYDFFPARPSVGKILLTIEEMHRLHVNSWKNFPWMDYMYKEQ